MLKKKQLFSILACCCCSIHLIYSPESRDPFSIFICHRLRVQRTIPLNRWRAITMEYTIIFDDLAFFFLFSFDFYATCGCWSEPQRIKRWISDRKVGGASNSRRINARKRPVSSCAAAVFLHAITDCVQESHNNHSNGFITAFRLNEIDVDVKWNDDCMVERAHARALAHIIRLWWTRRMMTLCDYESNSIPNRRIELSCTLLDLRQNRNWRNQLKRATVIPFMGFSSNFFLGHTAVHCEMK